MWHFECDGPVENGVKFCMYCGESIELIEYAESSEFYCNRDDCEYWFCYGDKSCCRNIPYGPNCLLRRKPEDAPVDEEKPEPLRIEWVGVDHADHALYDVDEVTLAEAIVQLQQVVEWLAKRGEGE